MHEAKTHLSRLVDLALSGEEIVIARRKQPVVRLAVIEETRSRRKVGALPGLVRVMGDRFNDSIEDWAPGLEPVEPAARKPRGKARKQ